MPLHQQFQLEQPAIVEFHCLSKNFKKTKNKIGKIQKKNSLNPAPAKPNVVASAATNKRTLSSTVNESFGAVSSASVNIPFKKIKI